MWFYLAAAGVIVVCLIILAAIVARKFPQAALVDTDSLPEEVAARKKKEIIQSRVARGAEEWKRGISEAFRPIATRVGTWFHTRYRKLLALERQMAKLSMSRQEIEKRVRKFLAEAETHLAAGKPEEAEKKYIEAVSFDPRSSRALRGLGELYVASRQFEQAREMYAFLVKVSLRDRCKGKRHLMAFLGGGEDAAVQRAEFCAADPSGRTEIAKNYCDLGAVCMESGQHIAARDAFENAAAFEPSNPRYLDLLLESCILEGAKKRAKEVHAALRQVNPENQKLEAFAERIADIPEARVRTRKRQPAEETVPDKA